MSCDSKDHSKHLCALKAQGLDDCIKTLSDNPVVECRNCGAKANHSNNVCAAQTIETEEINTREIPGDGVCGGY